MQQRKLKPRQKSYARAAMRDERSAEMFWVLGRNYRIVGFFESAGFLTPSSDAVFGRVDRIPISGPW